jgi:hypothetical protein
LHRTPTTDSWGATRSRSRPCSPTLRVSRAGTTRGHLAELFAEAAIRTAGAWTGRPIGGRPRLRTIGQRADCADRCCAGVWLGSQHPRDGRPRFAMQTIDNASRVRIQRRGDSEGDPLHGSAGRVTRRRGRGELTFRERRSRRTRSIGSARWMRSCARSPTRATAAERRARPRSEQLQDPAMPADAAAPQLSSYSLKPTFGIEPKTSSLQVAHFQDNCRRYG